ncbi:MAG: hypothetical protein IJU92_05850 [Spirochaetaceae bacterium]|nr:hypothetical protein [Spirochaetaceae bacterium]
MKKISFIGICIMLVCACQSNKSSVSNQSSVSLANPIVQSSKTEINKKLGLSFNIPQDATHVQYSIIAGKIAQCSFEWKQATCTVRLQAAPTTELEDISGFYYTWDNEAQVSVAYNAATARWTRLEDGTTVGICIWIDLAPGILYSVSMNQHATKENLVELANTIYVQMQGDV